MSLFSQKPELFAVIQPQIEAFVADYDSLELLINASHYYLNISLAGVDKGSTVDALLADLGVGPSEVAGIGDTEGDLPLRERVGFFACPANARPEIQAVSDYVSPYPDIRGVLDILDRPEVQRA